MSLDHRVFYRRALPHLQPDGRAFFITTRLKGSLPKRTLQQLREEREEREQQLAAIEDPKQRQLRQYLEQRLAFGRFDRHLDLNSKGPHWLKQPAVAQAACDAMHYSDGQRYQLDAYCVMSNHIHIVLTPTRDADGHPHALQAIMHGIKRNSAIDANKLLQRQGKPFWQPESYDHYIRDAAEYQRIIHYVLQNPVKAGLITNWQQWPWSYYRTQ